MSDIRERAAAAGCPMSDFDLPPARPVGENHAAAHAWRDGGPIWLNTTAQGFWMLTDQTMIREMLTTPDIFGADSIAPQQPNQPFKLIPGNINPPEHKAYRAILNPWFSPKSIRNAEVLIRKVAAERVNKLAKTGRMDVVNDYCTPMSTEAFLIMLGLPLTDRDIFMKWVEGYFRGFASEEAFIRGDGQQPKFMASIKAIEDYMADVVADRRVNPRDPVTDIVTALVQYRIDGRPLNEEELRGYTLLLFLGGMHTPASAMSWLFFRLAQRPEDQARLVKDPRLVTNFVEESLRYDTVVMGAGRKVRQDAVWHGVEFKTGDMVWGVLPAANRDPAFYDEPNSFNMDRDAPNMAFSGGIHRCVASHFGRAQLRIVLEEFIKVIPTFEVEPGIVHREFGAVLEIDMLPLRWNS